jgi:glutamate synthase (NADPH/NADH) small chain
VTIAYRRGESSIPAFAYEYGLARSDGVRFEWFARPVRVVVESGRAVAVEFERTQPDDGPRTSAVRSIPGSSFVIEADMIIKALGQVPLLELLDAFPGLEHRAGRILADPATGATTIPRLFAGGDCTRGGGEVVDAVRDGKMAAKEIDMIFKKNQPQMTQMDADNS